VQERTTINMMDLFSNCAWHSISLVTCINYGQLRDVEIFIYYVRQSSLRKFEI